jgi:hypothetical protein
MCAMRHCLDQHMARTIRCPREVTSRTGARLPVRAPSVAIVAGTCIRVLLAMIQKADNAVPNATLVMLAGLILRGCGLRIPQQDRAAALDLGRRLRWQVACRRIHPRRDGWSLGRRAADHRRLLHWRELRLVQSVCGAVWRRAVSRSYAAGACWLVKKCQAEIRDSAHRLIPYLAVGLFFFLIVVFACALAEHLRVIGLRLERPYLFAFPAVGAIAALVAASSFVAIRTVCPFTWVR